MNMIHWFCCCYDSKLAICKQWQPELKRKQWITLSKFPRIFTLNNTLPIKSHQNDWLTTRRNLKNGSSSNSLKKEPPNIVRCLCFSTIISLSTNFNHSTTTQLNLPHLHQQTFLESQHFRNTNWCPLFTCCYITQRMRIPETFYDNLNVEYTEGRQHERWMLLFLFERWIHLKEV